MGDFVWKSSKVISSLKIPFLKKKKYLEIIRSLAVQTVGSQMLGHSGSPFSLSQSRGVGGCSFLILKKTFCVQIQLGTLLLRKVKQTPHFFSEELLKPLMCWCALEISNKSFCNNPQTFWETGEKRTKIYRVVYILVFFIFFPLSTVHSFIQHTFMKYAVCVRHWGYSSRQQCSL